MAVSDVASVAGVRGVLAAGGGEETSSSSSSFGIKRKEEGEGK